MALLVLVAQVALVLLQPLLARPLLVVVAAVVLLLLLAPVVLVAVEQVLATLLQQQREPQIQAAAEAVALNRKSLALAAPVSSLSKCLAT